MKKEKPYIKFGGWVEAKARIERYIKYKDSENPNYYRTTIRYKFWKRIEFKKPIKVMFLGYRTLSNGDAEYVNDAGYVYKYKESVKAALVCADTKTNPFYVLVDDLEIMYPF